MGRGSSASSRKRARQVSEPAPGGKATSSSRQPEWVARDHDEGWYCQSQSSVTKSKYRPATDDALEPGALDSVPRVSMAEADTPLARTEPRCASSSAESCRKIPRPSWDVIKRTAHVVSARQARLPRRRIQGGGGGGGGEESLNLSEGERFDPGPRWRAGTGPQNLKRPSQADCQARSHGRRGRREPISLQSQADFVRSAG